TIRGGFTGDRGDGTRAKPPPAWFWPKSIELNTALIHVVDQSVLIAVGTVRSGALPIPQLARAHGRLLVDRVARLKAGILDIRSDGPGEHRLPVAERDSSSDFLPICVEVTGVPVVWVAGL